MQRIALTERPLCTPGRVGAGCAGVVRRPVVLQARYATCGTNARCAVRPFWAAYACAECGQMNAGCAARDSRCAWYRLTPVVPGWFGAGVVGPCGTQPEAERPERRTRRCSRPLRAQDRWLFGRLCHALAAAERQAVGRATSTW